MKYFFPIHLDGGNRGCEAIAKGTALLIDEKPENLVGYCRNIALDTKLGIDKYMQLIPCKRESILVDKLLAAINKIFRSRTTSKWRNLYPYRSLLKLINPGDIMISTGGDMMCYGDNEVVYTNNELYNKGVKTILWGCSMGPENLSPAKRETLSKFSLLYARESLTYNFFKELGMDNVCLCPDPAFILPAEECILPNIFTKNNVIGINISNFVVGDMNLSSTFGKEVIALISYILKETNLHILLIPHVTWNFANDNQDDRMMALILRETFGNPERITILDIDDMNYCQIRYTISKCRFFIGARTHAVISAYSMCIPTIALGYSIKSRGIAKDLGLSNKLIVNSKDITKDELCISFKYMYDHEEEIRSALTDRMPSYKQEIYNIRGELKKLLTK